MKRITDKILQAKVDHLNELTNSPPNPYTRNPETGKLTGNVGNHYLAHGFQGVNLYRLANEAGGIKTPLGNHARPRRELADALDNYAAGYRAAAAAAR
jgi:hypothetical protein